VEVLVDELLTKLENKVKQALERIAELESQNTRLKEENESLVEARERLQEELEEKEGEVGVIAELRVRLEAAEAKQELARRRIEAIIAELDEILAQGAEDPGEPVEAEVDPSDEEEGPVPPGVAFPVEVEEPPDTAEEEPEDLSEDTFPLLDFEEGGNTSPGESGPLPEGGDDFADDGEEPDSGPFGADGPTDGDDYREKDEDKDPFGGSF
jgi:seryl-tRNA synthetase